MWKVQFVRESQIYDTTLGYPLRLGLRSWYIQVGCHSSKLFEMKVTFSILEMNGYADK